MSQPDVSPIFLAAVDVIRSTGAKTFEIRWCEEQEPTIWMALSTHVSANDEYSTVYAGFHPDEATVGLAEKLIDGGVCAHCLRMTIFEPNWTTPPIKDMTIDGHKLAHCTYQYDPELQKFRRSCEGET